MRHIRVLLCRLGDGASVQLTERAAFDVRAPDPTTLRPTTALDQVESTTRETGNAILRRVLQAQSEMLATTLTEDYRQPFSPSADHARQP